MMMQRLRGDAEAPWPADPAEIIDRYPRESRRLHRASDPAGETADDVDGPGNSILERDIEAASVQRCEAANPGYGRRAGDRDFLDACIREPMDAVLRYGQRQRVRARQPGIKAPQNTRDDPVGDNDPARLTAAFGEPVCNPGCENLVGLAARCREAPTGRRLQTCRAQPPRSPLRKAPPTGRSKPRTTAHRAALAWRARQGIRG